MEENKFKKLATLSFAILALYALFFILLFSKNYINLDFISTELNAKYFLMIIIATIFALFMIIIMYSLMKLELIPRSRQDAYSIKIGNQYKTSSKNLKNRINKLISEIKQKNNEIEKYKKTINTKDITSFLKTTPHDKVYLKTIQERIKNTKSSLCICNTHWDHTLSNDIASLKDKCRVRIISKPKNSGSKEHEDAYNFLKKIYQNEMKDHRMLHCRLILIDDSEVIIGSADLDANGMNNEFQAGVVSKNTSLINDSKQFFEYLWKQTH